MAEHFPNLDSYLDPDEWDPEQEGPVQVRMPPHGNPCFDVECDRCKPKRQQLADAMRELMDQRDRQQRVKRVFRPRGRE